MIVANVIIMLKKVVVLEAQLLYLQPNLVGIIGGHVVELLEVVGVIVD